MKRKEFCICEICNKPITEPSHLVVVRGSISDSGDRVIVGDPDVCDEQAFHRDCLGRKIHPPTFDFSRIVEKSRPAQPFTGPLPVIIGPMPYYEPSPFRDPWCHDSSAGPPIDPMFRVGN